MQAHYFALEPATLRTMAVMNNAGKIIKQSDRRPCTILPAAPLGGLGCFVPQLPPEEEATRHK